MDTGFFFSSVSKTPFNKYLKYIVIFLLKWIIKALQYPCQDIAYHLMLVYLQQILMFFIVQQTNC